MPDDADPAPAPEVVPVETDADDAEAKRRAADMLAITAALLEDDAAVRAAWLRKALLDD